MASLFNTLGVVKLEYRTSVGKTSKLQRGVGNSHSLQRNLRRTIRSRKPSQSKKRKANRALQGSNLSLIQKKVITETLAEKERAGGFQLIFPNENYLYYKDFFDVEREFNREVYKHMFESGEPL